LVSEIGLEHGPHLVILTFFDRGQVTVPGVVHQHIDTAECLLRLGDSRADLSSVGDIQRHAQRRTRVR